MHSERISRIGRVVLRPEMLVAYCCLGLAVHAVANERTLVLGEHLGRAWRREWLTYPITAEPGVCQPETVSLADPKGGLIPAQLADVEWWPDGNGVRSARLHFIIDALETLAEHRYTVRFDGTSGDPATAASDLDVRRDGNTVTMDTGHIGARLVLGRRTWETPVPATEAPGPLAAWRLSDDTWSGASRLFGDTPLIGWSGELTAKGPVFGEVRYRYDYADGHHATLTARIVAGDTAIYWDMTTSADRPEDGVCFVLNHGLPPLTFRFPAESGTRRSQLAGQALRPGTMVTLPLTELASGMVTRLTPWNDWWDDTTQTEIVLTVEGSDTAMSIAARDAGDWVEPAPPGTWRQWTPWQHKLMPLRKLDSGELVLEANLAGGEAGGARRWIWIARSAADLPEAGTGYWELGGRAAGRVGRYLNTVKDHVLAWPDGKDAHPRLFVSHSDIETFRKRTPIDPSEIETLVRHGSGLPPQPHTFTDSSAVRAWLLCGTAETAERVRLAERLVHRLGLFGHYDRMRLAALVVSLYDIVIDTVPMDAADRRMCRARLAYLGYVLASPDNWSMERGYRSGNLNMSIAHVLSLGLLAAAIPEHPQATAWSAPALTMMDRWLETNVGEAGEFLGAGESQANYAPGSVAKMLVYAMAARRAGFHDFINDPRMRRLMVFMAQQLTPPDPRFPVDGQALRRTPPSGRGPRGQVHGLHGLMARATADDDPAYSAVMQWAWLRSGSSRTGLSDRMSGLEVVALDPTLPFAAPDWVFDVFPAMGAIMRHGVDTPAEWYINLLLEPSPLTAYAAESGGFPGIWAFGIPISVRFGGKGYAEREELLISRVLPARAVGTPDERRDRFHHPGPNRLPATAALPRQHYAMAELTMAGPADGHASLVDLPAWPTVTTEAGFPIRWLRQILFVRDATPEGVNYLALRDTVSGGQPTMWQFWTLSDGIFETGTTPPTPAGNQPADARPLNGHRFTATGQLAVDLDFFVAAPQNTPRHTLRWGTEAYHIPAQHVEYQDLLHLQQPGDGAYYVILFPRRRAAPTPRFDRLADGAILRITGDFGVDYLFLSDEPASAATDGLEISGTAAGIQDRPEGLILNLSAPGTVSYGELTLVSDGPAAAHFKADTIFVNVPRSDKATGLRLRVPPPHRLITDTTGATVTEEDGDWVLRIPPGTAAVRLTRTADGDRD